MDTAIDFEKRLEQTAARMRQVSEAARRFKESVLESEAAVGKPNAVTSKGTSLPLTQPQRLNATRR